jgi:hypothetical protein
MGGTEVVMADGVEIRASIDSETVRGLLLINGGGAVALLAFLAAVIDKPSFHPLAEAVMWAVFAFQVGMVAAVIHNRLRRLCSLEYAKKPENRTHCSLFGRQLREPCVCHWSIGFMWVSIAAFIGGGLLVLISGLCVLGR